MNKQDLAYMDYIEEHITNVQKAYNILHDDLFDVFNKISRAEMERRIKTHDQSKYSSIEFFGYRQWFYPAEGEVKDESLFHLAWKEHYTHNDHHPEHWKYRELIVEMHKIGKALDDMGFKELYRLNKNMVQALDVYIKKKDREYRENGNRFRNDNGRMRTNLVKSIAVDFGAKMNTDVEDNADVYFGLLRKNNIEYGLLNSQN